MPVKYSASAKANRNELAAGPGVKVTRFHGIDDEDWQDPEIVASQSGPVGSQPDGSFDGDAADEMLAGMGYRRTSPWANGYAPNYYGPRGQWSAEVEHL